MFSKNIVVAVCCSSMAFALVPAAFAANDVLKAQPPISGQPPIEQTVEAQQPVVAHTQVQQPIHPQVVHIQKLPKIPRTNLHKHVPQASLKMQNTMAAGKDQIRAQRGNNGYYLQQGKPVVSNPTITLGQQQ